jgi:hypothetical protein
LAAILALASAKTFSTMNNNRYRVSHMRGTDSAARRPGLLIQNH